jgi:vacuolar-type H+-ATPase subunit C/Vma6
MLLLTIKKALNKALYKFTINNIIDLLSAKTTKKIIEILDYNIQVSNTITIGIILVKF